MPRRAFAAVSAVVMILGVALFAVPAQAALTVGAYYCYADPNTKVYDSYQYEGTSGDEAFLTGKIVKTFPQNTGGCASLDGSSGDPYSPGADPAPETSPEDAANPPVATIPESPSVAPGPRNATPPFWQTLGGNPQQICAKLPGDNQVFWPYLYEGLQEDINYLQGALVRPFPNSTAGCWAYNDITAQEWEVRFGTPPTWYDSGAYWDQPTLSDGVSRTQDSPGSEGGDGYYRDPVPLTPNALAGCNGKYRKQSSNRIEDVEYTSGSDAFWVKRKVRLTAGAVYWFCPNGSAPDMVKVTAVSYCVTHWQKPAPAYKETYFNPIFQDTNTINNPRGFVVERQGDKLQACETQEIASADQRWFQIQQNAQWGLIAIIRLDGVGTDILPDKEVIFRDEQQRVAQRFYPFSDYVMEDWKNT